MIRLLTHHIVSDFTVGEMKNDEMFCACVFINLDLFWLRSIENRKI